MVCLTIRSYISILSPMCWCSLFTSVIRVPLYIYICIYQFLIHLYLCILLQFLSSGNSHSFSHSRLILAKIGAPMHLTPMRLIFVKSFLRGVRVCIHGFVAINLNEKHPLLHKIKINGKHSMQFNNLRVSVLTNHPNKFLMCVLLALITMNSVCPTVLAKLYVSLSASILHSIFLGFLFLVCCLFVSFTKISVWFLAHDEIVSLKIKKEKENSTTIDF